MVPQDGFNHKESRCVATEGHSSDRRTWRPRAGVCVYVTIVAVGRHSQFAPIRDSMRSRRRWRSRWTMKSSSERMRKEEIQLTTRRIPLAIESNRLLPSMRRGEEEEEEG